MAGPAAGGRHGIGKDGAIPATEFVLRAFRADAERGGPKRTLLAVCPNSETVLKATFLAAVRHGAPVAFAATLNQVDLDGGYTGWSQGRFVDLAAEYAAAAAYDGPVIVGLDHGGPWLKDRQASEGWSLEDCLEGLRASLAASLFAGYDLLHIDPTVDKTLPSGVNIDIATVIARTVELLAYAERIRRRNRLPAVSYEVGTEEVHGGLADLTVFRRFLTGLKSGLAAHGLADTWPILVVGKVGTDLHTSFFDPDVAHQLVALAGEYGSLIKGHYTDSVENPSAYPEAGMGAANVGPEFTQAEYEALLDLTAKEEAVLGTGVAGEGSCFRQVLTRAVLGSGRWMKWRLPEESGVPFTEYAPARQEWLVKTGCRYVWTHPEVREARARLYANLARHGIDGERIVLDRIARAIGRYYEAFNLIGANDVLVGWETARNPLPHA